MERRYGRFLLQRQRFQRRAVFVPDDQLPAAPSHRRSLAAAHFIQDSLSFLDRLVGPARVDALGMANGLLAVRQIKMKPSTHALPPQADNRTIDWKLF